MEMMKSQSKVELLFYSRARTRRTEPLAASVYQDHDPDQSALHSSTRSRFLGHKRALIHRTHLCVLAPRLIQRSIPAARPLTWGGRGRSCFPFSLFVPQICLPLCIDIKGRKKKAASSETTKMYVPYGHAHMHTRHLPLVTSGLVSFPEKIHASCGHIIGVSTVNTRRKTHTRCEQHITPRHL